MKQATTPTSWLTRFSRFWRLVFHVINGLWIVYHRFPKQNKQEKAVSSQAWAKGLLDILNIKIKITGTPPALSPSNTLIISNHISWLDICALSTVSVSRFVAKKEIASWPILGKFASHAGTLFIDRSNRRDAARINELLAEAMVEGDCMSVFPEAMTSDGLNVLPFKSSLFESALLSKAQVVPAALRYLDASGQQTIEASYAGNINLIKSLCKILRMPTLTIEIHYGQSVKASQSKFESRFVLSNWARNQVLQALNLPVEDKQTA